MLYSLLVHMRVLTFINLKIVKLELNVQFSSQCHIAPVIQPVRVATEAGYILIVINKPTSSTAPAFQQIVVCNHHTGTNT